MVEDFTLVDRARLPFYIFFPRDFTCWHIGKRWLEKSKEPIVSFLHMALLLARHRGEDDFVTAEWEKHLSFDTNSPRFKWLKKAMLNDLSNKTRIGD